MLLLLKRLFAPVYGALELAVVALHVPVELRLTYELAIVADWALEFHPFSLGLLFFRL